MLPSSYIISNNIRNNKIVTLLYNNNNIKIRLFSKLRINQKLKSDIIGKLKDKSNNSKKKNNKKNNNNKYSNKSNSAGKKYNKNDFKNQEEITELSPFLSKLSTNDHFHSLPSDKNEIIMAKIKNTALTITDTTNNTLEKKLDNLPTDTSHINFYNAMNYQLDSGVSGRIQSKTLLYESNSPFSDIFFKNRTKNLKTYILYFWTCKAHSMPTHALSAFKEMCESNIKPNIDCYVALISACKNKRQMMQIVVALYKDMLKRDIKLNLKVANSIISTLGSYGTAVALETAFSFLDIIKRNQLSPDLYTYTSLMVGAMKVKQYERAWTAYRHMQESYIQPDQAMYNMLLKLCAAKDESEKALGIYSELLQAKVQPNVITFNELIRALARRPDMYTQAFDIFEQMKSKGVTPNEYIISTLLYASACQKDIDASFELWKLVEMLKLPKYPVLYNAMLNVLARSQTTELIKTVEYGELTQGARILMASKMISEIGELGLPLEVGTLNNALNCLTSANRVYEAFEFFSKMYNTSQKPTEATYMSLLRMCNANRLLEKAEFVYKEMKKSNMVPKFEVFCIMLRLFAEIEDRKGALPYLVQMKELGYQLRSRSIRLSIPTFFTMNEENRERENIQGEMPYSPDLPAYLDPKVAESIEITYPYSSDMLRPQRDERLKAIEANRWKQIEKEYEELNNEEAIAQADKNYIGMNKALEIEHTSLKVEERELEYVMVKSKNSKIPNERPL